MKIRIKRYDSPCGSLLLGEHDGTLLFCDWDASAEALLTPSQRRLRRLGATEFNESDSELLDLACRQLDEYFAGERRAFRLPVKFHGTDFQKKVWQGIADIPFGTTLSYSEVARRLGCPRSVRAVANAIGANPLSIIVPCHRVVGADGSFTGYAGGLEIKKYLLTKENQITG